LAHDRDRRALAGLDRRAKRGLDSGDAALDLEALRGEELREPGGGLDLLVAKLGVVVDPARELLEVVAEAVDGGGDRVFEGGHLALLACGIGPVRQADNYTIARRRPGCARGHRRSRLVSSSRARRSGPAASSPARRDVP